MVIPLFHYLITTNFKHCLWPFKWGSCNGGSCGRFLFSVASFVVSDAVLSHISNKLWVQLSVNGCGDSKWILSQAVQTSHMHPWSVLNGRQPIHDLCCITSQCTLRLYGYSFFFKFSTNYWVSCAVNRWDNSISILSKDVETLLMPFYGEHNGCSSRMWH